MVEVRAGSGEHHLDLQLALANALLAHDALDLALRGDTHLLEELAQRHVELVFVHWGFSSAGHPGTRAARIRDPGSLFSCARPWHWVPALRADALRPG